MATVKAYAAQGAISPFTPPFTIERQEPEPASNFQIIGANLIHALPYHQIKTQL